MPDSDVQKFEFQPEHDGTLPVETAVFQALGAASMCWGSVEKAGVFQSDRAKEIGDALVAYIREHFAALPPADDIKRIDIAEFRQLGYLQEVNRRVLHPCGLALEVLVDDDGSTRLGGVWDYRDDPEGMCYGPGMIEAEKIASVANEAERHAEARVEMFGDPIQGADMPESAT